MDTPNPTPERSWLFRIDLCGRGTGQIESLTGYIARMAAAHFIRPSTLLHRGLEWWDAGQPEHIGKWKRRTSHLKLRPSINAPVAAQRWIGLLEKLSPVQNLAEATVGPWAHLFPARGLLRQHHAWCPRCFGAGSGPYDRLLWSLAPVKVCPEHRCRLVHRCLSCDSRMPPIHARSVPGTCPRCEARLADTANVKDEPEDSYDLWTASAMADFLETVSQQPSLIPATRAPTNAVLAQCMASTGLKDVSELARLLTVSRITAWYWLTGKAEPDLPHTLRIAYAFDLPLLDILSGQLPTNLGHRREYATRFRPIRRTPKHFDHDVVAAQINVFCGSRIAEPPSLEDVGHDVGFSPRVMRRHFPVLCQEISRRHRQRCREKVVARRAMLKEALREALRASRLEKLRPSRNDIASKLSQPGILRSAEARNILRQLELEFPQG